MHHKRYSLAIIQRQPSAVLYTMFESCLGQFMLLLCAQYDRYSGSLEEKITPELVFMIGTCTSLVYN